MSDLFHENVTDAMLDQIFAVMALCPQHVFQILTKRPIRMQVYLTQRATSLRYWDTAARGFGRTLAFDGPDGKEHGLCPFPLPNVWLGVSIEDQKAANIRIPLLLQTPAAVRIVSAEPLLELLDLTQIDITEQIVGDLLQMHMRAGRTVDSSLYPRCWVNALTGQTASGDVAPHLDQVICGGESGPGARPMHPLWARTLRDDCTAAGVSFFFKQHGEWMPVFTGINPSDNDPKCRVHEGFTFPKISESDAVGQHMWRVGKKGSGDRLDNVQWHQFPARNVAALEVVNVCQ
jgi:protein gp37